MSGRLPTTFLLLTLWMTLPLATRASPPAQSGPASGSTAASRISTRQMTVYIQCAMPPAAKNSSAPAENKADNDKPASNTSTADLIKAIAALLDSMIWPAVTVILTLCFKNEIAALLARLKSFKAGAAEADFTSQLDDAEADAQQSGADVTPAQPLSPDTLKNASVDPKGTILSAWQEVESAVQRFYAVKTPGNTAPAPAAVAPLVREIQKAGLLDAGNVGLFNDLRALRNNVAHSTQFNPSADAAMRYAQLAKQLTSAISQQTENDPETHD